MSFGLTLITINWPLIIESFSVLENLRRCPLWKIYQMSFLYRLQLRFLFNRRLAPRSVKIPCFVPLFGCLRCWPVVGCRCLHINNDVFSVSHRWNSDYLSELCRSYVGASSEILPTHGVPTPCLLRGREAARGEVQKYTESRFSVVGRDHGAVLVF